MGLFKRFIQPKAQGELQASKIASTPNPELLQENIASWLSNRSDRFVFAVTCDAEETEQLDKIYNHCFNSPYRKNDLLQFECTPSEAASIQLILDSAHIDFAIWLRLNNRWGLGLETCVIQEVMDVLEIEDPAALKVTASGEPISSEAILGILLEASIPSGAAVELSEVLAREPLCDVSFMFDKLSIKEMTDFADRLRAIGLEINVYIPISCTLNLLTQNVIKVLIAATSPFDIYAVPLTIRKRKRR